LILTVLTWQQGKSHFSEKTDGSILGNGFYHYEILPPHCSSEIMYEFRADRFSLMFSISNRIQLKSGFGALLFMQTLYCVNRTL